MTILAIMSIVLGLCGATVTGIKEWRTALTARVQNLVSAVKEVFEKISKQAGKASQDGCKSPAKEKKERVFEDATKEIDAFNRWHWRYEKIIWLPITILLTVATYLTVRLIWISPDRFREIITSPSTTDIRIYQWVLIATFLLNAGAGCTMLYSVWRMQVNNNSLTRTATTLEAVDIKQQVTAVEPIPNRAEQIAPELAGAILREVSDDNGPPPLGISADAEVAEGS